MPRFVYRATSPRPGSCLLYTSRGSGLGSKSHADPNGVELAPRQEVGFDCPKGHHFEMVFAEEAELPTEWECPKCGETARRSDGVEPEVKACLLYTSRCV